MSRLGFSIYPEHNPAEKDKAYIDKMVALGAKRVFTCLLSAEGDKDEILNHYKDVIGHARGYNLEVIVDVAPSIFEKFGLKPGDLRLFHEMGATGIRLDEGFSAAENARLTSNPYGLSIELNASSNDNIVGSILAFKPNTDRLLTCHNFYPQRYTGLGQDFFDKTSQAMKHHNMRVAAFVGSNNPEAMGPWPVKEGLVTLEDHRDLPIDAQIRQLVAHPHVDDIIISNVYPTQKELEAIAKVNFNHLQFKIALNDGVTDIEKAIIFDHEHYVRGDMSEYMARSTIPRLTYADADIEPRDTKDLLPGDIVVLNNEYGRYKGELHIVLKPMKNEGNKNVVGKIVASDIFNMRYIDSWKVFGFVL